MKHKKWLVIIPLFLALVGLCVIPRVFRWVFEEQLASGFKNTSLVEYVFVDNQDILHIADSEHDMFAVTKNYSNDGFFKEVVAFDRERIWFVFIEYQQVSQKWNLASINYEGRDFKVHYADTFMTSPDSKHYEVSNECRHSYFEDKNCYYTDGKIVLTDHAKIIEYDLLREEAHEFNISEYKHPMCPVKSEISNYSLICLSTQKDSRLLTFAEAARLSKEFSSILKYSNRKTWDGTSVLAYLFDSVIYDGSNIYLVCRVLNYMGETHLVVFRYLYDTNELNYCFNHFNNDVINNGFYIVPKANNCT